MNTIDFYLVIPQKSPRLREPGLLDACALQILRCAQDDSQGCCHPERSEGSLADLWVITSLIHLVMHLLAFSRLSKEWLSDGKQLFSQVDARNGRKNARMSSASSSGSSSAAKCPPRGISVQRCTRKVRSAHSRGGTPMSLGKMATPAGHSMCCPGFSGGDVWPIS